MDRVIDIDEIEKAMNTMKLLKCAGSDGFTIEFYHTFWNEIKITLYYAYQDAISSSSFHLSARRVIISLMEKLGRNLLLVKNWRPLSLMNVDYKIFEKVLGLRLQPILNRIIHRDQTGFLKGRYIGENLLELLATIGHAQKHDIDAIVVSFDFEKAFDKIEWDVLDQVLQLFNFGDNFRSYIKLCQIGMQSTVLNNGFTTKWFSISRSVRQGAPLSSS